MMTEAHRRAGNESGRANDGKPGMRDKQEPPARRSGKSNDSDPWNGRGIVDNAGTERMSYSRVACRCMEEERVVGRFESDKTKETRKRG